MIQKIKEGDAPSLVLLQYNRSTEIGKPWLIQQLVAIHPIFLTESTIEARNILSITAKRAGWQGCNIRIDRMPEDGLIEIVRCGQPMDKELVRRKFASGQRLAGLSTEVRSWIGLTLSIVRLLGNRFTLREVYARKAIAEEVFPNNRHIEAKLRQQLLRDLGFVQFLGHGTYSIRS